MKSHVKNLGIILATLILLVAGFNNCSPVFFDAASQTSASLGEPIEPIDPGNPTLPIPPIPKDPEDFESFSFEVPFYASAVDVVFVIDNSQSMSKELENLGSRFTHFSSALQGKDWQACLITTDWENEKGHFRKWEDGNYVLNSTSNQFADVFKNTLNQITTETPALSYYEHGIRSTYEAVQRAYSPEAQNCFRPGVAKAVLIVSDEDEMGEGWTRPTSEQPHEHNKPENLIQLAKDKFGLGVKFSAHAVAIKPGDLSCLNQQRSEAGGYEITYGYEAIRYHELVSATKGVFASVCEPDFSQPLKEIGEKVLESVSELELPCADEAFVQSVDIQNAQVSSRSYEVLGKKIKFNPALVSGERAEIQYKCVK